MLLEGSVPGDTEACSGPPSDVEEKRERRENGA